MEDIAFHMTEGYNEYRLLCEDISDDDLRRLTADQFPNEEDALIKTLLNSLLVPKILFRDSRYTIHLILESATNSFLLGIHCEKELRSMYRIVKSQRSLRSYERKMLPTCTTVTTMFSAKVITPHPEGNAMYTGQRVLKNNSAIRRA